MVQRLQKTWTRWFELKNRSRVGLLSRVILIVNSTNIGDTSIGRGNAIFAAVCEEHARRRS